MKRIEAFLVQLLKQVSEKGKLNQQQISKLNGIQPVLTQLCAKQKQEVYNEAIRYISENVLMAEYQIQPVLSTLFQKYFKHFQLLKQCACIETERANRNKKSKFQPSQSSSVYMVIERPYISAPLSEAVEIQTQKGISLDPSYLD